MIPIRRYSENGFIPQEQNYHLQQIELYLLSDVFFLQELNPINDYQAQMLLQLKHKKEPFLRDNLADFKRGIWVFVENEKLTKDSILFELNHLNGIIPTMHQLLLPEDTIIYDCNFENKSILSDKTMWWGGVYIPERCLKNIK